jgi:hypothetical protein
MKFIPVLKEGSVCKIKNHRIGIIKNNHITTFPIKKSNLDSLLSGRNSSFKDM